MKVPNRPAVDFPFQVICFRLLILSRRSLPPGGSTDKTGTTPSYYHFRRYDYVECVGEFCRRCAREYLLSYDYHANACASISRLATFLPSDSITFRVVHHQWMKHSSATLPCQIFSSFYSRRTEDLLMEVGGRSRVNELFGIMTPRIEPLSLAVRQSVEKGQSRNVR